jgi:hypothetical protein
MAQRAFYRAQVVSLAIIAWGARKDVQKWDWYAEVKAVIRYRSIDFYYSRRI